MKKLGQSAFVCIACLMLGTPLAMAHDRSGVNWSVSIGSSYPPPVIYSPPPVVYVQPHPVYVYPHPTYVAPRPIYVQPAPVVRFGRAYGDNHSHRHHYRDDGRPFRSHGRPHRHD